ncbi:DUF1826 domain-containing protein [Primorskyibacter sp. 2E107]|uniref:DUF1826 domain-containing protein n=1 Tax=Primorskyibacter sp. 2E107 TaxID=3403458 RepID=UPI003AF4F8E6
MTMAPPGPTFPIDPHVLQPLRVAGVSLAMGVRSLREDHAKGRAALPAHDLPRLRRRPGHRTVAGAIREACDETVTGQSAALPVADVAALAARATRVVESPLRKPCLPVTVGPPSPARHINALPGRLLCILRGSGTEYGPTGEPHAIPCMKHVVVGVFRGAPLSGRKPAAIVHRPPPCETGGKRPILMIDRADDTGAC